MDQAGRLMARVEVPYVQRFEDRHGKVRHYFRKPGCKRVTLPGLPWSPEFMAAYHTALGSTERRPVALEHTKPGTLGALLLAYYTSADFLSLKPTTQANYKNILERFRADYGHNLVADLTTGGVRGFMDERAATPGAARNFLNRLRKLLDFAVEREWIATNPALVVKRPKQKGPGFRAWTDEDIAQFEAHWPKGSRARVALALLLYTGQRRSDVVTMGRQHVRAGKIHVVQIKTGARLWIKLHAKLAAELDELPKDNMSFLMTAYGKPMTPAGFTGWFVECAASAGLPARSGPHGLRKAAARRLAEAGCTAKQIAAVTGHRTLSEVAAYTDSADQERLADQAIASIS